MSFRLCALVMLLPASAAIAQGSAVLQRVPKDLHVTPLDPRLMLPRDLELGITGQGALTVAGQTCASKPGQDYTGCTLKVPGMAKYQVVATPAPGLSLAAWHWSCADSGLESSCLFKPTSSANGNKVAVTFVKGVPVTLAIPKGPGTIDQKVTPGNAPVKTIQCSADAGGATTGACKVIAVVGSTIVLKPLETQASAFQSFASSVAGCNGASCAFTVTGPTTISASFQPMATMVIDASFPMKQPVIISSAGAPNVFTCIDDSNKSQSVVGSIHCTARVAKGSKLAARIYFDPNKPGASVQPVPTDRLGGACAGQPAGTCTVVMDGDKTGSVAYALQ